MIFTGFVIFLLVVVVFGHGSNTKPAHHRHHSKSEQIPVKTRVKPPVFVINLKESTDRLKEFEFNVGKKSHLFGPACRVEAIDFRKCKEKYTHIDAPWWERGKEGGLLASGMSHRRAWAMVVKKKLPVAIIMEDDVNRFSWDMDQVFNAVMEGPMEYDVFRFSTMFFEKWWINSTKRQFYKDCHFMSVYKHLLARNVKVMPHYPFGAAIYAITYEGAKKGLRQFNPLNDIIDGFSWMDNVQCYLPSVATADGGNSRTTRKTVYNQTNKGKLVGSNYITFLQKVQFNYISI